MKFYNLMMNVGLRLSLSIYIVFLIFVVNKKLVDVVVKILFEMKVMGYFVDVSVSDVLMVYIKDGFVDFVLRWFRFMSFFGIRINNFIIRQFFELCMKSGFYELVKLFFEIYVNSVVKVDFILYILILVYFVRC